MRERGPDTAVTQDNLTAIGEPARADGGCIRAVISSRPDDDAA